MRYLLIFLAMFLSACTYEHADKNSLVYQMGKREQEERERKEKDAQREQMIEDAVRNMKAKSNREIGMADYERLYNLMESEPWYKEHIDKALVDRQITYGEVELIETYWKLELESRNYKRIEKIKEKMKSLAKPEKTEK